MELVFEPERYECTQCAKSFKKEIGLHDHLRDVHDMPYKMPKAPEPPNPDRRPSLAEIDPKCVECGEMGLLVTGDRIWPDRPSLREKRFYLCQCGAYVSCHPNSVVPMGFPCGPATRKARQAAHHCFDPLWQGPDAPMDRRDAYLWLSEQMDIDRLDCHIGMMTADQARQVISKVANYWRMAEKRAAEQRNIDNG